jgi:hypothetical protein
MESSVNLVNAAPATDAPRRFHSHVSSLTLRDADRTTQRVLHHALSLRTLVQPYSRAHWLEARFTFVPTHALADRSVIFTVAGTSDASMPTTLTEMWEVPGCEHHVSGRDGELPGIISYSVAFASIHTSPLIKPPPIEMNRTAISYNFSVADDSEIGDSVVLYNVFLSGTVQLGGQA